MKVELKEQPLKQLLGVVIGLSLVVTPMTGQATDSALGDNEWSATVQVGADERNAADELILVSDREVRYTIRRGDTLGEIAREYGVSAADIRSWNGIEGDFIRAGDTLIIHTSRRSRRSRSSERSSRGSYRFTYVVERGDTLSGIAGHYGVSVSDIVRWNRSINPDMIRVGQEIRLYLDDRPGRSASVGRPDRGRLSVSERLRNGPGYRVRAPSRAYGTNETIEYLTQTFARVHQRFPGSPELAVGDLSYETGGRMRPHVSHQSGRDADISYYTLGRESDDGFIVATPQNLDAAATWYLLKSLIDTGSVRYIFVDYELQGVLYDYARLRGASQEELDTWFQYPHGRTARGLIRHSSGHDDHFHIRFRCSSSDRRCRD